jgi:hypothetical protein
MSWLDLHRLGCTGFQVPVGVSHTSNYYMKFSEGITLGYAISTNGHQFCSLVPLVVVRGNLHKVQEHI